MANNKKPYERLARDLVNVQADRYYIWTWRPRKYWHKNGWKANYQKHYCCQPFYTRYHAKKTAVLHIGVDALSYIHIVSGRHLLKQGYTKFAQVWCKSRVFIKDKPMGMPPWIFPPEYRFDKHRRYMFRYQMRNSFKRGRKYFNETYAFSLYGYTQNLDKKYLAKQRLKENNKILRELQKTGDI